MPERILVRREWVERAGTVFVPASAYDLDLMRRLPVAVDLAVDVSASHRSGRQHRLYWALLQKVVENSDHYASPDALSIWLKIRLGYVDDVVFHDGTVHYQTKSLAFHKMDQGEFNLFFNRVVDVLVTEVLPGINRGELMHSVEEMLGISISDLVTTNQTEGHTT